MGAHLTVEQLRNMNEDDPCQVAVKLLGPCNLTPDSAAISFICRILTHSYKVRYDPPPVHGLSFPLPIATSSSYAETYVAIWFSTTYSLHALLYVSTWVSYHIHSGPKIAQAKVSIRLITPSNLKWE